MRGTANGKSRYYSIVLAGFIIMGIGLGLFHNCTSAFLTPVSEALGFSRGKFTIYSTVSQLVTMIMLPYFGTFFAKYGIKKVMIAGTVVCSAVPILYSFSTSLWQFYIIGAINGLFINSISILATGTLINSWFKDKKGLATAIAFSGSGLVSAIMVSVITSIIETTGWQSAYRLMGVLGFAILMPVIVFIVKDKPEDVGLAQYRERDGAGEKTTVPKETQDISGLTRSEAMKTPALWLVLAALAGLSFVFMGMSSHTISYLRDLGYPAIKASAVQSTYMFALVFTKILIGIIADKQGPFKAAMFSGFFCILMPVVALFAYIPQVPWAYALCMALATSAGTVLPPLITESYFGQKEFSSIYSLLSMASTAGSAISPPVVGSIFDATGSYAPAFYMCIGIGAIAVLTHVAAYIQRPERKAAEQ